jgi:hypothetical protein
MPSNQWKLISVKTAANLSNPTAPGNVSVVRPAETPTTPVTSDTAALTHYAFLIKRFMGERKLKNLGRVECDNLKPLLGQRNLSG